MAEAYCLFHQRYMDSNEVKVKLCRKKSNSKKRCRHLIMLNNQKYRNDGTFIATHKR